MPNEDLQKHTLNLYRGDYDKLQDLFPHNGAGPVIRELVHSYLAQIEAVESDAPEVEIKL